jgi:hypothetical protein
MENFFKPEKEQMLYHFLNLFLFSGKKKYMQNKIIIIIDYHTATNFVYFNLNPSKSQIEINK